MSAPKGNQRAVGNPGGGRPSSFKDEFIEWAEKLAKLGATDADMADAFDVSEVTINNWKKAHPGFSLALKKGKTIADARVASALFHRAIGYEHAAVKIFNDQGAPMIVDYTERFAPDTTAAIFWLKNRQPALWRDTKDIDHKSTDGSFAPTRIEIVVVDNDDDESDG